MTDHRVPLIEQPPEDLPPDEHEDALRLAEIRRLARERPGAETTPDSALPQVHSDDSP